MAIKLDLIQGESDLVANNMKTTYSNASADWGLCFKALTYGLT